MSPSSLGGPILKLPLLTLLVIATSVAANGQQDPRIASWTLISAQSALDPANKLTVTSTHGGVHVVMSGETHFDFTAKPNGHQSPAPGNLGFDQVELHRIDKKQFEAKETKDGALVATVHNKLSSDGKELTITTSGKAAGNGRPDQITVWTRSGGAKSVTDPLAGEWTQDQSKSRMRQGLALKIEADGKNGVRFSGDYSYDARFGFAANSTI